MIFQQSWISQLYRLKQAARVILYGLILTFLCVACFPVKANAPLPVQLTSPSPASPRSDVLPPTVRPGFQNTPTPAKLPVFSTIQATQPLSSLEVTPSSVFSPTQPVGSTSDLLFLSDSALVRWEPGTEQARLLEEDVQKFSPTKDGSRIAILHSRGIAANGTQQYELTVLEANSGNFITLLTATPELPLLSGSPDGRWVAYIDPQQHSQVLKSSSRSPDKAVQVGACNQDISIHCTRLLWSPDSRDLMWSDRQGLWVAHESQPAKLAAQASIQTTDPHGEKSNIQVVFNPVSWSPAGRFALVEVIPSATGVHWLAVVDTRSGRMVEVPQTFSSTNQEANRYAIGWLTDGRLAVASSDPDQKLRYPSVNLFQVIPTHEELLVFEKSFVLFDEAQLLSPTDHPGISYSPSWLAQTGRQQVSFALIPSEITTPPVLVTLDLKTGQLSILGTTPNDILSILWSTSRADAVVLGKHSQVLLLPADGGPMVDLRSLFGTNLQDFIWLENASQP
jgi:hypothetical protein